MTNKAMRHLADLCRAYADARDSLEEVTEEIRDLRRQAVRAKIKTLKNCVAKVSAMRERLRAAVEAAPHLFESPRTRAIDGIKIGFRKMPGRVEGDEAAAVARIRKHFPEQAAALIRTRDSINRVALKNLDGKQLAKIGLVIAEVDDEVVVAAASSDLDRLVDALLAEDGEEG